MSGRATAPASAANLGPGFDAVALALELRVRVDARPAPDWAVTSGGEPWPVRPDDLVVQMATFAAGAPLALDIDSDIPPSRGLGSSAAVATAVYGAAARAAGREPTDREVFAAVAAAEGHPDNAAAAVYGGLTVALGERVRRLELHPSLVVVVGIPDTELPTAAARAALADSVPRSAASRNLARVVFLIEGLRTADGDALTAASGDELHEAPRAALSPTTGELMWAARDAGALHTAWGGAGPSALAFTLGPDAGRVRDAMAAVFARGGPGQNGRAVVLDVAKTGWS